jgi:hypothetical protein
VDAHFVKHVNRKLHDIFLQHSIASRKIRRTPEWDHPIPGLPQTPEAVDGVVGGGSSKDHLDLRQLGGLETTTEVSRLIAVNRHNISTKEPAIERQHTNETPAVNLGRRAWKDFSTIFHMPSEGDHVREISWVDFLHAMTTVAFVPEKLSGSAWQFTPSKFDCEKCVYIYDPCPSEKIASNMAGHLGKRLLDYMA